MNVEQARSFVKDLAVQSYGSGSNEGVKGGNGSIGLIGGKPVKFNTHWYERSGKATPEMVNSSNELRVAIGKAALAIANDGDGIRYNSEHLEDIFSKLGLSVHGGELMTTQRGLLSRKVVAETINMIDFMLNENKPVDERKSFFDGAGAAAVSSKGVNTKFSVLAPVVSRVEDVRASLDDIFGEFSEVRLNREERDLLMGYIERDLQRKVAEGTPLPDAAKIKLDLGNSNHPALSAVLQCTGKSSERFFKDHPTMIRNNMMQSASVYLSGAPKDQVADRIDLQVMLLNIEPSYNLSGRAAFTMALVSEKLPKMRQLQPHGPLTLDTVWKACFGKDVPKDLERTNGEAVSKRFEDEAEVLVRTMTKDRVDNKYNSRYTVGNLSANGRFLSCIDNGFSFSASVEMVTNPGYKFDPSRDLVAKSTGYYPADAASKDLDDIVSTVANDFGRTEIKVSITNGDNVTALERLVGKPLNEAAGKLKTFFGEVDRLVLNPIASRTQLNVTKLLMGQSGLNMMNCFGVSPNNVAIKVSEGENDSINIHYETTEGSTIKASYDIVVKPDGSNQVQNIMVR